MPRILGSLTTSLHVLLPLTILASIVTFGALPPDNSKSTRIGVQTRSSSREIVCSAVLENRALHFKGRLAALLYACLAPKISKFASTPEGQTLRSRSSGTFVRWFSTQNR